MSPKTTPRHDSTRAGVALASTWLPGCSGVRSAAPASDAAPSGGVAAAAVAAVAGIAAVRRRVGDPVPDVERPDASWLRRTGRRRG